MEIIPTAKGILKERKRTMKNIRKVLAVILCFAMLCGTMATASSASLTSSITATAESRKSFGNAINDIIQAVVKGVCRMYPAPRSWKNLDTDYDSTYIYDEADGRENYLTAPAENAQWKVGYASESIIPDDFEAGKYYIGRQLNFTSSVAHAKAQGILDDQRVRVICIDDCSGEGAVVMAVIDGLGVTSATIRKIRAELKDYVDDGRIAAINVSATHCHCALDTQGVSNSLLGVLVKNITTNLFGKERAATDNDHFIDTIVSVTSEQIRKAYAGMESGTIYYDTADTSEIVADKRGYISPENSPEMGILRFAPDDESSKGTYLVNFTCHPTISSYRGEYVSSDYVYYLDRAIQESGSNFIMLQGAVGQLSRNWRADDPEKYTKIGVLDGIKEKVGDDVYDEANGLEADCFGEKVAEVILNATADDSYKAEEVLEPVINAKYTYTQFTTENYTLHLACRCRLVDNEVYKTGCGFDDVALPSEIGYLDFGGRVAFGLLPAELYPEVFHGTDIVTNDVENYSWDGSTWDIDSAHDMVKPGIDVYAVCFANDYIGYVVPDNFYSGWGHWALKGSDEAYYEYDADASIFDYVFRGTADQLLSAGKKCGSQIMTGFEDLVDSLPSPAPRMR